MFACATKIFSPPVVKSSSLLQKHAGFRNSTYHQRFLRKGKRNRCRVFFSMTGVDVLGVRSLVVRPNKSPSAFLFFVFFCAILREANTWNYAQPRPCIRVDTEYPRKAVAEAALHRMRSSFNAVYVRYVCMYVCIHVQPLQSRLVKEYGFHGCMHLSLVRSTRFGIGCFPFCLQQRGKLIIVNQERNCHGTRFLRTFFRGARQSVCVLSQRWR